MADDIAQAAGGTVETLEETVKNPADFVKFWLAAIELSGRVEKDWREDAKVAIKQFRTEGEGQRGAKFNILYANIQTTVPAIYNSEPAADIRPRFGEASPEEVPDADPQNPQAAQMAAMAKQQAEAAAAKINKDRSNVSTAIERAIAVQSDMYDYDDALQAAVKDRELLGRAVTRLRINLTRDAEDNVVSKHVTWEPVIWDDFRMGPAKRWPDVPWVAFKWLYTRDELEALSPERGKDVKLDATLNGSPDKASDVPDSFKRATVWEIWDRETRRVYFIAESFKDAPVKVDKDPYRLREFFPTPKPRYAITTSDSLVPICPFIVWQAQQTEMNDLTRRISALIKVIRWRGVYDGAFEKAVQAMKDLDDGELAPAPDAARAMVQGQIDKAFWMMPVEEAINTVKALYEAREACKQTIYELTGVADILRGSTKASETLGAQKLKAEWGSLRLQSAQRDVQMHARDLMRMTADLLAEHFEPELIQAMTGIALTPDQMKLLKQDMAREFNIDIETDGTIKADLSRTQENIGGFITGFGQFIEAVGPAVQAGFMNPEEAVGLLRSFARSFKLGREPENILDDMSRRLEAKAKEPPQPPPPDPKMQVEQMKAQTAQAKSQADMQMLQAKGQTAQQGMAMDMEAKQAEHGMKMQAMDAEKQRAEQQHAMEMQGMQADAALKVGEHLLKRDDLAMQHEAGAIGHGQKLEVMDAQTKAKQAMAAMKPKPKGEK